MPQTVTARAALFDMDGTLVNSTAVVERIWLEWARPHRLDPETVLSVVHGRQGHLSMAILLPDRPHQQNIDENQALLARESADVTGVVAIPGAADILTAITGHPHALVTSADVPLMTARMSAAGLRIPDQIVTAEDVSASKPDPEGFLRAARMLGASPEDCIVFEDSGAGIQAGLAAGMRVIGVGGHAAAHQPSYLVDDLTQITLSPAPEGFTLTLHPSALNSAPD